MYVGTYSISEGIDVINIITVEMTSANLEDGGEFLWDSWVYALVQTQQCLEAGENLNELDDDSLLDSHVPVPYKI